MGTETTQQPTMLGNYELVRPKHQPLFHGSITDAIVVKKPKTGSLFMIPLGVILDWIKLMKSDWEKYKNYNSRKMREEVYKITKWDKYHHAYDNVNYSIAKAMISDPKLHFGITF